MYVIKFGNNYLYSVINGKIPVWSDVRAQGMRFYSESMAAYYAIQFGGVAVLLNKNHKKNKKYY